MDERLPYPIFDRPLMTPPLFETPRVLNQRPSREAATNAFNRGLELLLERGLELEERFNQGEFAPLGSINAKIATGGTVTEDEEALMRDFGTLLDARDARYGRRDINIARRVALINTQEANGLLLTTNDQETRDLYQAGEFHRIADMGFPLSQGSNIDRFIVPARDEDDSFAIIDGAPVEGIIRELDRRIEVIENLRGHQRFTRYFELRRLRSDRDTLYTSSSEIFRSDTDVVHARKQYEAKLKNEDPILSEWSRPDWYKIELSLRNRRVLDLRRGRSRWFIGCLPLVGLIPLVVAVPLISQTLRPGQPVETTATPAPTSEPAPIIIYRIITATPEPTSTPIPTSTAEPAKIIINTTVVNNENPCYDVPNGQLRVEVFDLNTNPDPSARGANQRELYYQLYGRSQRDYLPSDDPNLNNGDDNTKTVGPSFYNAYLRIAQEDEVQTAQRIRGDKDSSPWVQGTDFSADRAMLFSCTTPQQREEAAQAETNIPNHQ